jgi:hypothetical protein
MDITNNVHLIISKIRPFYYKEMCENNYNHIDRVLEKCTEYCQEIEREISVNTIHPDILKMLEESGNTLRLDLLYIAALFHDVARITYFNRLRCGDKCAEIFEEYAEYEESLKYLSRSEIEIIKRAIKEHHIFLNIELPETEKTGPFSIYGVILDEANTEGRNVYTKLIYALSYYMIEEMKEANFDFNYRPSLYFLKRHKKKIIDNTIAHIFEKYGAKDYDPLIRLPLNIVYQENDKFLKAVQKENERELRYLLEKEYINRFHNS